MPKKKKQETPAEQRARFIKDAEELISAGKLDPEMAAAGMDELLRRSRSHSP